MLGTKPSHDDAAAGNPTYNLADAAIHIMWICALAAARAAFTSTARGLAFWSQTLPQPLRPPAVPPAPSVPDSPEAAAASEATLPREPAAVGATSDDAPAFASYRSAGGHAAAQVVVAPLSGQRT